jgi:hypothetical protein
MISAIYDAIKAVLQTKKMREKKSRELALEVLRKQHHIPVRNYEKIRDKALRIKI